MPDRDNILVLEGDLIVEWEETFIGGVELHQAIEERWPDEKAFGAKPAPRHRYRITVERLDPPPTVVERPISATNR